ncbi:Ger(x)C family spore germination protein [Clostridium aciditolerans]|uniref:Ger(X)C family spore germination protein n=1 Tax=Clostridium aciditolerans TaxID=339861 RepID=A0A934HXF7_9CLOT|nr:Ger(x)C family spore germination protein [Clostridium aciditolerans]MBI6872155.1 Ger(x)C family spore germination protein [Clostridium aciditolerans]
MTNKRNKVIILYLVISSILLYSFIGPKGELVENLEIPIGVGIDLEKKSENDISYSSHISSYLFQERKIDSTVLTGVAKNIGETREKRQLRSPKSFLLGLEAIVLLSEEYAEYGIRNEIDILLNNPQINDMAFVVICKERSEDIFKHKVKGYSSSSEFIQGLIKNAKQFNFFPEHEYTLMDTLVRIDAEGRTLLLPYIELIDGNIKLTGIALFKVDKMVAKANIEETKIINILKYSNVKGMLTIQDSSKKYINFYAESKKKVKCYKEDDKFRFVIDLSLNGPIVSNTLYANLKNDPKLLKEVAKDIEKNLKETCEDFVNNKIKEKYKIDVLGLGKFAAGKYGRGKGIDWDKVISESIIEVNVKVKIDNEGRGDY